MGYCKRCGEILFCDKCKKCGNTTLKDVASSNGLKARDVWTSTYVNRQGDTNRLGSATANLKKTPLKSNVQKQTSNLQRSNTTLSSTSNTNKKESEENKINPILLKKTISESDKKEVETTQTDEVESKIKKPLPNIMQRLKSNRLSIIGSPEKKNNNGSMLPPDFRTKRISLPPLSDEYNKLKIEIDKNINKRESLSSNKIDTINETEKQPKIDKKSDRLSKLKEKLRSDNNEVIDNSSLKKHTEIYTKIRQSDNTKTTQYKETHEYNENSSIKTKESKERTDAKKRSVKLDHETNENSMIKDFNKNMKIRELTESSSSIMEKRCNKCRMQLDGEYLYSSNGNYYHDTCFVCFECNRPFVDGTYMIYKEKEYHKECAPKTPLVLCLKCNKTIEGRYIKNKSKSYHPQCFTCYNCQTLIDSNIRFGEIKNATYCENCIVALNAEKRKIK